MKAKDLIKVLKELPPDTEVVFWEWDSNAGESVYRQLTLTCNYFNEYNKKKKQITLTVPEFPRKIDPIYLENKR